MALPKDAAGWQTYLDESFPGGMQFNYLDDKNELVFPSRFFSMLKVVAMHGEWPVLVGYDALMEDYDVWIYANGWRRFDRYGHFVARVIQDGDASAVELSSWLDPRMETELARLRDQDDKALSQIAESAAHHKDI